MLGEFLLELLQNQWLELLGTFSGLACIYYEVKENYRTWIFAVFSSIIYAIIFMQNQMYGQMLFQIVAVPISVRGLYLWLSRNSNHQPKVIIHNLSRSGWLKLILATSVFTAIVYSISLRFSTSEYVFMDSLSGTLGVIALLMLNYKIIEQWLLWIIANGVPGVIMFINGFYPSAILFASYTFLALIGYYNWYKLRKQQQHALLNSSSS